jgi:anti-sigma factor ChrR (cupin superfamily)
MDVTATLQPTVNSFVVGRGMIMASRGDIMNLLRRSLKDLLEIRVYDVALAKLDWKDFGKGLSMARLAREGAREMVLYRIKPDADPKAFLRHEHIGGEFYFVLKGGIKDETGVYTEGDIVYLDPKSVHTPQGIGETVVLVLWPEGVRLLD